MSLKNGWSAFFVARMKPDILMVSTSDRAGGAEQIAWSLLEGYLERGCRAALAVGTKSSQAAKVREIPQSIWRKSLDRMTRALIARHIHILPQVTFQLARLGDLP